MSENMVINRLTPRVDIKETPEAMVLLLDLPGVQADNVEVQFERGELTVRASRPLASHPGRALVEEFDSSEYYRAFLLSQDVAGDRITADLKHGVLTVTLPRAQEALPRKIAVTGA
ncbi:MAG: Hsp20/alpha crystallin family protein [Gemmataceae bacterium]